MNRYDLIGLVALLVLVIALPIYATFEPGRMDQAQAIWRQQVATDGAVLYVENCAPCHGPGGEGIGAMPALNNPDLAEADHTLLYDTIAHSPHGTAMSAWHVEEGGPLNEYQVEGLVTLIRYAEWTRVEAVALDRGLTSPTPSATQVELANMEGATEDPHECRACHEEPAVHADRFGLNCSRCHTLDAWKPALLLRHTFRLDHGDEGNLACQTCHTTTYAEHTCYECHDHQPAEMETVHLEEGIAEFEDCVSCHPTGESGEAQRLLEAQSAPEGADGQGISEQINQGRR
jgi:mono/diheme cytochrome c family protein